MQRALGAIVLGLALGACTAMRTIPQPSTHTVLKSVEVGQDVEVITLDGRRFAFEVTGFTETELMGLERGRRYRIAFTQISAIKVEERRILPSLAAAAYLVYVVLPALGALALFALLG